MTWQKITEVGKILLCNRALLNTNECKEYEAKRTTERGTDKRTVKKKDYIFN
jgi:hypothetical protein